MSSQSLSQVVGSLLRTRRGTVGALVPCRHQSKRVKRFYKSTSVAGSPSSYEVNLDERKLKTPQGNLLQIPSLPLALAVAEEWRAVTEEITPSFMHLTGLSYTVVDNPTRASKWDMAEAILEFLPTDTLLFADDGESEEFSRVQEREWKPVLRWFNKKYGVNLVPSHDISPAKVDPATAAKIRQHITSYNHWAVAGLQYGTETLKSVILTLAAMERFITTEEAVSLSRLETEYQANRWGRVEWSHDMEKHDSDARFSAAILFAQLNTASEYSVKTKGDPDLYR